MQMTITMKTFQMELICCRNNFTMKNYFFCYSFTYIFSLFIHWNPAGLNWRISRVTRLRNYLFWAPQKWQKKNCGGSDNPDSELNKKTYKTNLRFTVCTGNLVHFYTETMKIGHYFSNIQYLGYIYVILCRGKIEGKLEQESCN